MKTKFKYVIIILFHFLIILNFNCGADNNIVKVGIIFPLSGELADKGLDSTRGIQLAVDEINSRGGIHSLGGAKIVQVVRDTKGNPDTGIAETEKLINEDNVSAIIGTYQSSVTKQATQVAEKYRTPFIVSISLADIITERGFRYTFRIEPKVEFYCKAVVRFLLDLKKNANYSVRRVALIYENSDYGTSTAYALKKILREHNLDIVTDITYNADGIKSLSKEMNRVFAAKPDAILGVIYFNDSILIAKELEKKKTTIPFIDAAAGGTVSADFIRILGKSSENIMTIAEFSKFTENGKDLNERFSNKFGTNITGDSAYAYQSVFVLKDALERAGSVNRESIRDALSKTDIVSAKDIVIPAERIKFNKQGQNEAARLFIVQIQNGEYIPVWPEEYAKNKVIIKK